MKKIAGPLRLELAQYRELAAFSQFSKDLDKATQDQLNRGERIVELLKQPQNTNLTVGEQVTTIFATTHGYTDELKKEEVSVFKKELVDYMNDKNPDLLRELKGEAGLTDELSEKLNTAIDKFHKEIYLPAHSPQHSKQEDKEDEVDGKRNGSL